MSWWKNVSAARLLVTVVVDEPFTQAHSTYTEATRRIERGNIEAFAETGRSVSLYLVSDTRFVTPEPTPLWGNLLPGDLDRDIRNSVDGRVHTRTISTRGALPGFGELRIHSPAILNTSLELPPAAVGEGQRLHEPWLSLFPGRASVEFWLLKRHLEQLATTPTTTRREIAATMARERTASIVLPSELPLWDLRAAEDQEEVLADAAEQFDIHMDTWPELRQSQEFQERVYQPMSVMVAKGWAGVIWLQMHLALLDTRLCQFAGCDTALEVSQRKYCAPHKEEAGRVTGRDRQRRRRRGLR